MHLLQAGRAAWGSLLVVLRGGSPGQGVVFCLVPGRPVSFPHPKVSVLWVAPPSRSFRAPESPDDTRWGEPRESRCHSRPMHPARPRCLLCARHGAESGMQAGAALLQSVPLREANRQQANLATGAWFQRPVSALQPQEGHPCRKQSRWQAQGDHFRQLIPGEVASELRAERTSAQGGQGRACRGHTVAGHGNSLQGQCSPEGSRSEMDGAVHLKGHAGPIPMQGEPGTWTPGVLPDSLVEI